MTPMAEPARPVPDAATDLLGCGTPVEVLVDQADAGRLEHADDHQAGCRYCRAALRDAVVSRRELTVLGRERGALPLGLVERVMGEVRSRRGTDGLVELGRAERVEPGLLQVAGGVRVHQQVLADLARVAAAAVDGVTVARAGAAGRAGGVDVTLGLLVDGRTPLPELARDVRRAVRAALRRATGFEQVDVALTALDLVAEL